MFFRQLFDPVTSTYTYLLADAQTGDAVLIDPVLEQLERDVGLVRELGFTLRFACDTHVHADHVSALGALRKELGAKTVMCAKAGALCPDFLAAAGDRFSFGAHRLEVLETPGHTDGCVSYVTGDRSMVFTGDALLIRGCGRTDFQQGDAALLYRSVHGQLFALPDETFVYPGHDYKGRTRTTVGEEKRFNPRLGGGRSEAEFIAIMNALNLPKPAQMDRAVPANLSCGQSDEPLGPDSVKPPSGLKQG
jgi:sulfur dioxygenase